MRIKLVISDLHLGKGKNLRSGGINSFEEFHFSEKFAEFIQYYSSGAFRDAEVELILNGDFLNFTLVDFRGHYLTVLTESVCLEQLESIISGHPKVFSALKDFAFNPKNSITYIIGNHDQAMLWPACRERLNAALGSRIRYKNIVYYFDGIHIEHGHMQEAANRFDPRRFFLKKDLAEPILNLPYGTIFFTELVLKIKQRYPFFDKVRPISRMMRWFFLNEFLTSVSIFSQVVVYLLKSLFAGKLERTKASNRKSQIRTMLKILFEAAVFPDLTSSAQEILEDERVHTVIFGHSLVYQYKQFPGEKEYLNTGTWTEVTSLDIVNLGRITKLTYAIIEYVESERPRARLKEWRGFHRIEEDMAIN